MDRGHHYWGKRRICVLVFHWVRIRIMRDYIFSCEQLDLRSHHVDVDSEHVYYGKKAIG